MEVPLKVFEEVTLQPGQWLSAEVEGFGSESILILNLHAEVQDSRRLGRTLTAITSTWVPMSALEDDNVMLAFIRKCLQQWALHEVDEWFRFRGELVNDPHSSGAFLDTGRRWP